MLDKLIRPKIVIDPDLDSEKPTVVVSTIKPRHIGYRPEKELPESILQKATHLFMDFLETITVAASIFIVVYLFLVQPHEVRGSSMEPSFFNKEYILTDKFSYRLSNPERGDVIIFQAPTKDNVDFIKRVIGLPEERVKIQNGKVYINDNAIKENYLNDPTSYGAFMKENKEIILNENEYFVMGDNRPASSDSRDFGPIKKNSIKGKARIIYWPFTKAGIIEGVQY